MMFTLLGFEPLYAGNFDKPLCCGQLRAHHLQRLSVVTYQIVVLDPIYLLDLQ
jgi:hypothetical protein